MKGTQRRMVCEKCGKVFFAWRPDELPGAQVKCYFCGHTFADEAARRPPAPVPQPPPAPAQQSVPAAVPAPANATVPAAAGTAPAAGDRSPSAL